VVAIIINLYKVVFFTNKTQIREIEQIFNRKSSKILLMLNNKVMKWVKEREENLQQKK